MSVTEFPKRGDDVDDRDDGSKEPVSIVGLEMQIKLICKCDPSHTVLVCLGKMHEVICPHCRRAYRLTFLHFDPADPATLTPDGSPLLGIHVGHRQIDGVIIPAAHRVTPPMM